MFLYCNVVRVSFTTRLDSPYAVTTVSQWKKAHFFRQDRLLLRGKQGDKDKAHQSHGQRTLSVEIIIGKFSLSLIGIYIVHQHLINLCGRRETELWQSKKLRVFLAPAFVHWWWVFNYCRELSLSRPFFLFVSCGGRDKCLFLSQNVAEFLLVFGLSVNVNLFPQWDPILLIE